MTPPAADRVAPCRTHPSPGGTAPPRRLVSGALSLLILVVILMALPMVTVGSPVAHPAAPSAARPSTSGAITTAQPPGIPVAAPLVPYVPFGPRARPGLPLDAFDGGQGAFPSPNPAAPRSAAPSTGSVTVLANASTTSGPAPLTVGLNPIVYGPPGYTYSVTFGDGTSASGTFTNCTWSWCDWPPIEHTYTGQGSYSLSLTITDGKGSQGQATLTISVSAPTLWAGWSQLHPSQSPSARDGAAMAYDPPLHGVVLFGGTSAHGTYLNDTWLYASGQWTNITSSVSGAPSPRYGALASFDTAANDLVLVGGFTAASSPGEQNDTWVLVDGQNRLVWQPGPIAPRFLDGNNELVDDNQAGGVLLTGEMASNYRFGGVPQTLLFSGSGWSPCLCGDPGVQWDPETYDGANGSVLSLSGNGSYRAFGLVSQTWSGLGLSTEPAWDGWTPMVYDNDSATVVLPEFTPWFRPVDQTWTYARGTWTNVTGLVSSLPSERYGEAVAYDGWDGYVLLFGGFATGSNGGYLGDTWNFSMSPSPLRISLVAQPSVIGLGSSTTLTTTITAGPASGDHYAYFGLPPGCSSQSVAALGCQPSAVGTFYVTVVVTDTSQDTMSDTVVLNVLGTGSLSAQASASPMGGPAPLSVNFYGLGTGGTPPYSYSWRFGDGGASSLASPTHLYTQAGVFPARLWVNDSAGSSVLVTTVIQVFTGIAQGWTNLTGGLPNAPSRRSGSAMAYDAAAGYVLLFGDCPYSLGTPCTNDTWSYSGSSGWTMLGVGMNAPSPRQGPAMAYDPNLHAVVLFGGDGYGTSLADTWEWTGGRWIDLTGTLSNAPPGRYDASMAWDPAVGALVLFGGSMCGSIIACNDTWEFNGAWTQVQTSTTPPGRAWPGLAWDASDHYLLMYGGQGYNGAYYGLGDTWEFNGQNWVLISSSTQSLPAGQQGTMSSDDQSGSVILLASPPHSNDAYTWNFSFGLWQNITPPLPTVPPAPGWAPMVWDSLDGYVLLFEGSPSQTGGFGQTWAYACCGQTSPSALQVGLSASPSSGSAPFLASFTLSAWGGTSPYQYNLSFGDGTYQLLTGVSGPVTHSYNSPGNYIALLTVNDSSLPPQQATAAVTISVVQTPPPPLTASAVMTAVQACVPVNATFQVSTSGGAPPLTYTWDPNGTGTVVGSADQSFSYATPGVYTPWVNVSDSQGQYVLLSGFATVNATSCSGGGDGGQGEAPLRVEVRTLNAAALGQPVNFVATVTGGAAPYDLTWSFGDGSTLTTLDMQVAHTYLADGSFPLTVTVTDRLGAQAASVPLMVGVGGTLTSTGPPSPASDWPLLIELGLTALALAVGALLVLRAGGWLTRRRSTGVTRPTGPSPRSPPWATVPGSTDATFCPPVLPPVPFAERLSYDPQTGEILLHQRSWAAPASPRRGGRR